MLTGVTPGEETVIGASSGALIGLKGQPIPHSLIHRGMIDQVPVIAEIPLGRLGSQGYL